jgi:hypothetical protein
MTVRRNPDALMYRIKILNFKLKMTDPNRFNIFSISKFRRKSKFIFFLKKIVIFLGGKKIITIGRFKFLKSSNFLLTQKITKEFQKKYKI